MGSMSAMNSLHRVLETHSTELLKELTVAPPGTQLTYVGSTLENNLYSITVTHMFRDMQGNKVYVSGESIDIDTLAERFPNCDVGY